MLKMSENYIRKLIESGLRSDNRKFDSFRKIKIETDYAANAEGSAKVTLGDTQVLVGVKLAVGEPFPDTPEEGVLIVGSELVPIASPTFEPGPPNENAIELARVVDRGIRESKSIELEKLCIEPAKLVWIINIDIHVLDHDGNLTDAAALGAIAALLKTKMPKYEEGKMIYDEKVSKLPVIDKPVAVTIGKISGKLLVDSDLEEESALDARLTIVTNSAHSLCAMQKSGNGFFTPQEVEQAIDLAITKGEEVRGLLR